MLNDATVQYTLHLSLLIEHGVTVGQITVKGYSSGVEGEHRPNAALDAKGTHRPCWHWARWSGDEPQRGRRIAVARRVGEFRFVCW